MTDNDMVQDGIYLGSPELKIPVYVFPDEETLGIVLAQIITAGIAQSSKTGKQFLLGCPGGRSGASTYTAIGQLAGENRLDLSDTVIVMMDNYVVKKDGAYTHCPDNAHYSCYRFAKEHIQNEINCSLPEEHRIPNSNIWLPDPEEPEKYDQRIENSGGIDFFITASGASDGHVAFNPPGSPRNSRTRIVRIAETTRNDNLGTFPGFNSIDEVPEYGVSVGIDTIAALSKSAALVIHGAHKSQAVTEIAGRTAYDSDWPVSLIYESKTIGIFLDTEAAAGLKDIF